MNTYRKFLIPSLAVYAGLVLAAVTVPTALARSYGKSLTSPATPALITGADGFIKRWFLLEPIRVNGLTRNEVQAMVNKDYFPDEYTIIPKDGEKEVMGGETLAWHAVDTRLYNVNLYHFGNALSKPTTNVLFWVVSIVNSPTEMHNVRLAIGSNAASVWWVNGQEVIGIYGDRQTVIDDGVSKRLTLKKGTNIVRAAVVNGGGATDFCARFLDANDKPIKGLTVTLSESKR
jgi:hypothetical protein